MNKRLEVVEKETATSSLTTEALPAVATSSATKALRSAATSPSTATELQAAAAKQPKPVRVKLRRIDTNRSKPYPPEGMSREWWQRLKDALGTCSSDFVQATVAQLVRAARLPGGGTSEIAVNAALAFIEGAQPRDEIEAALVIQMACTHSAVMCVFSRFGGDYGTERSLTAGANAVSRLLKAYAMQVEALRRLRNGGSQYVRVEHVHINEGANVIVGSVSAR